MKRGLLIGLWIIGQKTRPYRSAQQALKYAHYNKSIKDAGFDPGAIDGKYGHGTEQRSSRFRRVKGCLLSVCRSNNTVGG